MRAWLADLTPPSPAERLADYYARALALGLWNPLEAHAKGQVAIRLLRRWCGSAATADDDELPPWLGERLRDGLHQMHRAAFPPEFDPEATPEEPEHDR